MTGEEELDIETIQVLQEPPLGIVLTIVKAEVIETAMRRLKGVRVIFEDEDKVQYATMLWLRDQVGPQSKIGAFIVTLGKNIKTWKGKKIVIREWRTGRRQIELVK